METTERSVIERAEQPSAPPPDKLLLRRIDCVNIDLRSRSEIEATHRAGILEAGAARMVDVTAKEPTDRVAVASGRVDLVAETMTLIPTALNRTSLAVRARHAWTSTRGCSLRVRRPEEW